MRFTLLVVLLCGASPGFAGEEFVHREVTGKQDQHVAVTHYFFDGDQCYGARREYSDKRMHVVRPKIYWDLYFGGELIATVDPDARSIDYMRAPEGTVLTKHLSRFTLAQGGRFLRVWDLDHNKLTILSQDRLDELAGGKEAAPPEALRVLRSFGPRYTAPTIDEAKSKMKKAKQPS